ncbi:MAG: hypothetical protein LUE96_07285 [Lachnospiraceae bacterium]|nr:hypothetical protein [Lachnospiraceae bacterium]
MIPEISITCGGGEIFANRVTMGQYRRYAMLMERVASGRAGDARYFSKRIVQDFFDNRVSMRELGRLDAAEFLTALKGVHFIMQDIITQELTKLTEAAPEQEESAFDDYDRENGYEEQEERNTWEVCGDVIDRLIKAAIGLMRESYSQCMDEEAIGFLNYLKFELENVGESEQYA